MGRLAARRLATGALTLLLVTGIVFALLHAAPGDAVTAEGEEGDDLRGLDPGRRAQLRALYRLDEPIHRQYLLWLGDLAHGELGRAFHDRRPVSEKIAERMGATVTLNVLALALAVGLALPLGCLAAWRPGGRWDRATATAGYLLYSLPAFWAALLLQIVFSVRLDWLPLYGLVSERHGEMGIAARLLDRLAHLVLPVLCLSYGGLAYLSRFTRASLLDSSFGETARAARARGASALRLVAVHGLRQAAVPMLTLAGFLLPALVAGSVIVETVFAIPGLGLLFTEALRQRDLPVVMGLTLLSGTATLAGVLAADLAYAAVDPRISRRDAR